MVYSSVLTDILWWPSVAWREVSIGDSNAWLAVAGGLGVGYYFLGLPSLSDGVAGFAYPYLGMGVGLYAANMIAKIPASGSSAVQ